MTELSNKKNYSLIDLCKFIFSFFIIAIHTRPFDNLFDGIIDFYFVDVICRYAVPFFFATSGFFFFKKLNFSDGKIGKCDENKNALKKYMLRLIILYTIWSIPYFIIDWFKYYRTISLSVIVNYAYAFFIQGSHFHMWYILCMIYAIPVIYILLRKVNISKLVYIVIVLWLIEVISYAYNWIPNLNYLSNISEKAQCIFESIFRAVPLISVGAIISQKSDYYKSNKNNIVAFVISTLGLIIEVSALHFATSNDKNYSYVLFTLPVCYFLFRLILSSSKVCFSARLSKYMRSMSTIIYMSHPMFLLVTENINLNNPLNFFIVSVASITIAFVISFLSQKIKIIKYLY